VAFRDLRQYIEALEKKQALKRIAVETDPVLEITEIADRMVKSAGPALFFENVKGSPYPLAINLFGTQERTCFALGVGSFDEIANRITEAIPDAPPSSLIDKMKFLWKLKEVGSFQPRKVSSAPSQSIIEENPNLLTLPTLQCWPKDAGRFITLPLVFTKNPRTNQQNVGMYRIQVLDEKKALIHWHVHHDGASNFRICKEIGVAMEVAIVLGGDPATIYATTAPLPPGLDEMIFAGFLRQEGVELIKGQTVDLM
jgi:4-hydroxy-3-polyprenylbenzoate decarboxylase